jgi:hypothetical protein
MRARLRARAVQFRLLVESDGVPVLCARVPIVSCLRRQGRGQIDGMGRVGVIMLTK